MTPPRVYIEVWNKPPTVCGPELAALVRQAGGEPFMPTPGSKNFEVSWEEVLEFDPQIVIHAMADHAPEAFMAVEGWNRTEAAVQKRVYSVDPGALDLALLKTLIEQCFSGKPLPPSKTLRILK